MKCISLWQPWSSLCVVGEKKFETRSWATSYRGPLLIHASKKFDNELHGICRSDPFATSLGKYLGRPGLVHAQGLNSRLHLGCIIGVVDLVDCYQVVGMECDQDRHILLSSKKDTCMELDHLGDNELAFGDYTVGRYAWELGNPMRFPKPIPFRGRQQLFDVPDALGVKPIIEEIRRLRHQYSGGDPTDGV